MTALSPRGGIIHGYVMVIGPETNPNYFTGASWSAMLDDAKVFRTAKGAKCAASHSPPSPGFAATLRVETVNLILEPRLL
jgi:hypothetical protein